MIQSTMKFIYNEEKVSFMKRILYKKRKIKYGNGILIFL